MDPAGQLLPIGDVARRSGLSIPTLRYYEQLGLIVSTRTAANQRRYPRHVLRRLAFVTAARRIGLSLAQAQEALASLPSNTAPTPADWQRLSKPWAGHVAARIRQLQALQNTLNDCLGCGCLSLTRCALYNPSDEAALDGSGSRWLREAMEDEGAANGEHPQPPANAPPQHPPRRRSHKTETDSGPGPRQPRARPFGQ